MRRQHQKTKRRIELKLTPFFGGRRMVSITPVDIERYKAARLADRASPATINRELTILKRMFSLAVKAGLLYHKPHIQLLREAPPRSGFFEDDQIRAAAPPARRHQAGGGVRVAHRLAYHQRGATAGVA